MAEGNKGKTIVRLGKKDLKKAVIDTSGSIVFWALQVLVVVVIVLKWWDMKQYFSWIIAYVFMSMPFAPFFGRFLNWWRRLLGYDK